MAEEEQETTSESRPPSSGQSKGPSKEEKQKGLEEFHPTAPSLGPHTVIERPPPEERLAKHEQSDVDAMGKDKRRAVVGHSYGPSKGRQAFLYGLAVAVVALLAIGAKLLIDSQDKFPSKVPQEAPWAKPDVKQLPPKPLQ